MSHTSKPNEIHYHGSAIKFLTIKRSGAFYICGVKDHLPIYRDNCWTPTGCILISVTHEPRTDEERFFGRYGVNDTN